MYQKLLKSCSKPVAEVFNSPSFFFEIIKSFPGLKTGRISWSQPVLLRKKSRPLHIITKRGRFLPWKIMGAGRGR